MNWVPPLNVAMTYLCQFGMLSAQARQIMTKEALRQGAKYIFYVDDDTLIPPLGLYTLHNFLERNPKIGAVSGVYTTRENPNEPLVYKEHGVGAYWDFPMGPKAEPVPIMGAGAGCLLVRLEAIQDTIDQMTEENGGEEVPIWADSRTIPTSLAGDGKLKTTKDKKEPERRIMWGHDIRFCRELNKHGWPVYVDGKVLCGHYDIESGQKFYVPEDAPGRKLGSNVNTQDYWDQIYSVEGPQTWRQYPEMFGLVVDKVPEGSSVVELGCGVGVLDSRLTAQKKVAWRGFDVSQVGVDMARGRFLDAEVLDINQLTPEHLGEADVIVATEIMEHLEENAFHHVISCVTQSSAKKFVFTVPDNCMGPDAVPEHTALFSEQLVSDRLQAHPEWALARIEHADEDHLLFELERA